MSLTASPGFEAQNITPTTFFNILKEFTHSLTERFPDNAGARSASNALGFVEGMPHAHVQIVEKWHGFTQPIAHHIRDKDGKVVGEALDTCEISLIREIGSGNILHNEEIDAETKESVWKYLQSLTNLSRLLADQGVIKAAPAPAPVTASSSDATQTQTQPASGTTANGTTANGTAASGTAASGKTDPGQIVKGITDAFPKILQSLNDVLKTDQGDNPLAQMFKTMMNPNQLQPGMANNVMANLMQQDASVMAQTPPVVQAAQQTGMSPDDIVRKLQRLENLEKARAKRRGKRHHK